ncbi:MAG: CxxC-x17-CxxC domain-containing protein [Patescibacteria group bacterium]
MIFKKRDDESSTRKMYQGNWKCSQCGAEITELPFEPSGDLPLYCRDCHRERLEQRRANRGSFQRKMYQGNWKCASCGTDITELPFEPKEGQEIYCRDCYRSQRA